MAAVILQRYRERRLLRRNRIFRDRTHPFDVFDDDVIFAKFRFRRQEILAITDDISVDILLSKRMGSLTPLLQVLITLRYFASGSFQDVCGELIGVDQSTVSRTVTRVTDVLLRQVPNHVRLPNGKKQDAIKTKFYDMSGFPNVVGCIDGTQVQIQAPTQNEHEFVNRKGYHSINVQLMCDADLIFINCIAKWPGSVHDSRILRESSLFEDFENKRQPMRGIILGDSCYMLRDWLSTPISNLTTRQERNYNFSHSSTRTAIERAIGVLKRRWHCLRRLRLTPAKACKVIAVFVMLSNRARRLNLDVPDTDSDSDDEPDYEQASDAYMEDVLPVNNPMIERARLAAGKTARERLMNNYFH
ncbi:putative nuclease HARBI1 [Gigantopelta aegis]|uniref:putative nuclease HARBI1 n=1 Tax=Gigantopelta aegis TaxID=1735272 RepID=UPI001B888F6A|nr:putative nuclease HARBI1 [Gigantopelta aegis]